MSSGDRTTQASSSNAFEVAKIKARADEAFRQGSFSAAADLYTEAITLDPRNEILYSNRSGSRSGFKDWSGALSDAERAIALRPTWPKGFVRKAVALKGMYRFSAAQKAYLNALEIKEDPAVRDVMMKMMKDRHAARFLGKAPIETREVDEMPIKHIVAIAKGRDLDVSVKTGKTKIMKLLQQHQARHPNFSDTTRRFYLIPSPDQPNLSEKNRHITIEMETDRARLDGAGLNRAILKLVAGARAVDSEILYSDDIAEILRGNPAGVGVGHLYKIWEVYMDDDCITKNLPLNTQACALLHRPGTRGPVLLAEGTHMKADQPLMPPEHKVIQDVIYFHPVDIAFLQNERWKEMREEWKELGQGAGLARAGVSDTGEFGVARELATSSVQGVVLQHMLDDLGRMRPT